MSVSTIGLPRGSCASVRASGAVVRSGYCLAVALALIAGLMATPGLQTARAVAVAGTDWANLLRAMAGLKGLMALGAVAGVVWRLRSAVSWRWLAAYGVSSAAMACGPGLIWGLYHVGLGALLLHAGLAATLVLLWRDPVVAARLAVLVARRRLHPRS